MTNIPLPLPDPNPSAAGSHSDLDVERPTPSDETAAASADILARSDAAPDTARLFPVDQTETSRPGEAANPRPATPKMDDTPPPAQ